MHELHNLAKMKKAVSKFVQSIVKEARPHATPQQVNIYI